MVIPSGQQVGLMPQPEGGPRPRLWKGRGTMSIGWTGWFSPPSSGYPI